MNIIIANFGNDSVALIQYAYEKRMTDVTILSVNTNWSSAIWSKRVYDSKIWIESLGFNFIELQSSFAEQVTDRKSFPSIKFHWCAGFLKGLPILHWLDEFDELENATIMLPNRKDMSASQMLLQEYIYECDYYNNRTVWHCLINHNSKEMLDLAKKSPLKILNTLSQECFPCVHNSSSNIKNSNDKDIIKTIDLEKKVSNSMFAYKNQPIDFLQYVEKCKNCNDKIKLNYNSYTKGCSWQYGCGL